MGEKEISRILITGGNGFIGSHLAEKLLARGDTVSLLDLKFNANTRFLDCEKIRGDIRDYQTVREAVDGKDAVIHHINSLSDRLVVSNVPANLQIGRAHV